MRGPRPRARPASLRAVFLAVGAGTLLLGAGCRGGGKRPNVVVVCFDTVRSDSFESSGGDGAPDALSGWGRRAVVYEYARSAAPWTVPSVATAMTGLYPVRHGAGRFSERVADLDVQSPSPLAAKTPTLAAALSRAGYDTAAFVSNPWLSPSMELRILDGFGRVEMLPTRAVAGAARHWLEERSPGRPFLVYLHLMDSHGGGAREEKLRLSRQLSPGVRSRLAAGAPGGTCLREDSEECVAYLSYRRGIELQRDDAAGLLDGLRARGLLSRTIVVLFADHGEEFGDHAAEERSRGTDPRPIYGRGHGQALYEELLRVPLLVWDPGEVPRADRSAVSLVDLAPTLLARAGLPLAAGVDGVELPRRKELAGERTLFASGIAYGPEQAALVAGASKRIAWTCPRGEVLFDLARDRGESRPLPPGRPDARLSAVLTGYARTRRSAAGTPARASEPLARLKALGYLSGAAPLRAPECSDSRVPSTTIGVFDSKTATFFLRRTNTSGIADVTETFGDPGDFPVVGDWDGDGRTDLGVYRRADRTFHLRRADGRVERVRLAVSLAGADDIAMAGDWDGDGIEEPALYRPATRTLYWSPDADGRPTRRREFGYSPPYRPAAGRWNGSTSELAFFHPPDAVFLLPEDVAGVGPVVLGLPGDVPLAGDWNGDGLVTPGVYRPDIATFFLVDDRSTMRSILFGEPAMIPIVGKW